MDDLYWTAPPDKMLEIIEFVLNRGPDYGYKLNMDKSIYLIAPCDRPLSDDELDVKVQKIVDLGVPACNIKIHPSCQIGSIHESFRRDNWGFKVLGAFIGTDE